MDANNTDIYPYPFRKTIDPLNSKLCLYMFRTNMDINFGIHLISAFVYIFIKEYGYKYGYANI